MAVYINSLEKLPLSHIMTTNRECNFSLIQLKFTVDLTNNDHNRDKLQGVSYCILLPPNFWFGIRITIEIESNRCYPRIYETFEQE